MKLPSAKPDPAGTKRAQKAKRYRDEAAKITRSQALARTEANGEETDHGPVYPANFTKGLFHDQNGLLKDPDDYASFVCAINSSDSTLFEEHVRTAKHHDVAYHCGEKIEGGKNAAVEWRGWESPRAGHTYDLEGPDAGAVGMAPAPRVGSSELAAEMAEVYALALLRDVPFSVIAEGGGSVLGDGDHAVRTAAEVASALNDMAIYSGSNVRSSTPGHAGDDGLNRFEQNRRNARLLSGAVTPASLFRGSTNGAHAGPYLSQFLLIGAQSRAGGDYAGTDSPGLAARFDLADGHIPYGALVIDQRTISHLTGLDYMTDWGSWLDVQNGADVGGIDHFEPTRRFITTPRDLATYVHYDALYQAYLNACLIMLSLKVPKSNGFPENSPSGNRTAFATFGDPHVLTLVTEVATRCLKAVRRQKFNYHRRARPEAIGGRLTLAKLGMGSELGCATDDFVRTLGDIPPMLVDAVIGHNAAQADRADDRGLTCLTGGCLPANVGPDEFKHNNLLLPMAFPEGSPMHPSYGAGHATVAGGCVTMLKAFFEMFTDGNVERTLSGRHGPIAYESKDGSALAPLSGVELTIQGELDKLAANIAIGRDMAGVHYYSDSLRMGERIGVGILLEQATAYGEAMATTFTSFDGDHITISGKPDNEPVLSVLDTNGRDVAPDEWRLRHVAE